MNEESVAFRFICIKNTPVILWKTRSYVIRNTKWIEFISCIRVYIRIYFELHSRKYLFHSAFLFIFRGETYLLTGRQTETKVKNEKLLSFSCF